MLDPVLRPVLRSVLYPCLYYTLFPVILPAQAVYLHERLNHTHTHTWRTMRAANNCMCSFA